LRCCRVGCSTPVFCDEIHNAARAGDFAKTKKLLKENPNLVASKDNENWNAFALGGGVWAQKVSGLLLAYKANINAKDDIGLTPLHRAAIYDHKILVKLLLANKAEVNDRADNGFTPLHYAAINGHSTWWKCF